MTRNQAIEKLKSVETSVRSFREYLESIENVEDVDTKDLCFAITRFEAVYGAKLTEVEDPFEGIMDGPEMMPIEEGGE